MSFTGHSKASLKGFMDWVDLQYERMKEANRYLDDGNKLSLFFRGASNSEYDSTPAIYRNQGLIRNEDIMFRECIIRNPEEFAHEKTTFDKLVKMQHYGLPTRLLDITSNPLAALYFACLADKTIEPGSNDKKHVSKVVKTGKVIAYFISKKAIKYYDSDTVSAVANIAKRPYEGLNISECSPKNKENNEDFRKLFNKEDYIGYLHHDIKDEKPYYQPLIIKDHLESIWCVKPKLSNARIARQNGLFLLFGILYNKSGVPSIPHFINMLPVIQKFGSCSCIFAPRTGLKFDKNKSPEDLIKDIFIEANKEDAADSFIEIMEACFSSNDKVLDIEPMYMAARKLRSEYASQRQNILEHDRQTHKESFEWTSRLKTSEPINKKIELQIKSLNKSLKRASCFIASNQCKVNIASDKSFMMYDDIYITNKDRILEELAKIDITADKLFPELDTVSKYLKDKYSEKEHKE